MYVCASTTMMPLTLAHSDHLKLIINEMTLNHSGKSSSERGACPRSSFVNTKL